MNPAMLVPAILSVSLLTIMASAAVSPALPAISAAFPGVDPTLIRLILSLPSLIVVPFSLLSGWLAVRFSKKTVILVALTIYVIAGAGGGLARSFTTLLVFRGLLGIGIGLLMPMSMTLIMDFFEGARRTKMMGFQNSVNQLGGLLFLSFSGWLACFNWRYAFGVYLLGLLSFVLIIFWLPTPPRQETKAREKVPLNRGVFGLAFLGLLMMCAFFVVPTDLGLYLQSDRPLFTSAQSLFKDQDEFLQNLQAGTVSAYARNTLRENGIHLAADARLSVVSDGKEWQILDGTKKYAVKKNATGLTVYSGLGTAALAGIALSIMTLGGIFSGLVLGPLFGACRNYLVPLATLLMAAGYALLGFASGLWTVFLSTFLIGLAQGWMTPPIMLALPQMVVPQARALAIAVISSFILFGQFISPLLMKGLAMVSGNNSFQFRFEMLALALTVGAILGAVGLALNSRKAAAAKE
jgi:MFS family permease